MPRGIGASVGVNEKPALCPTPRRVPARFRACAGALRPLDTRKPSPSPRLRAATGSAPGRPGGAGGGDNHDVARLRDAAGQQWRERQDGRGGEASRRRHPAGGHDPLTGTGELGQAVQPSSVMRCFVEFFPITWIGEAEARAEVDDRLAGGKARRERGRFVVRERGKMKSAAARRSGSALLECPAGQGGEMRMDVRDRGAGIGPAVTGPSSRSGCSEIRRSSSPPA